MVFSRRTVERTHSVRYPLNLDSVPTLALDSALARFYCESLHVRLRLVGDLFFQQFAEVVRHAPDH